MAGSASRGSSRGSSGRCGDVQPGWWRRRGARAVRAIRVRLQLEPRPGRRLAALCRGRAVRGEAESLRGRFDPSRFVARLARRVAPVKRPRKRRDRGANAAAEPGRGAKRPLRAVGAQEAGVLSETYDAAYRPRTNETRAAYAALLGVIGKHIGGKPSGVLGAAADEVLTVLKDDKIKGPDKMLKIWNLFGTISNQMFDQLVSTGKLITDHVDACDDSSADNTDVALEARNVTLVLLSISRRKKRVILIR